MINTRVVALGATALLAALAAAAVGIGDSGRQPSLNAEGSTTHPSARSVPGSDGSTGSESSTRTPTPRPGHTTPPGSSSGWSSGSSPGSSPSSSPGTSGSGTAGAPGPTGGADPLGGGSVPEILPTTGATGPDGSPTHVPTVEPPLLGAPLPESAAAEGRLVEGFPRALAPPAHTQIVSSSVVVAEHAMQATLVTTSAEPQAIVQHYRGVLETHGFAEGHDPDTDATAAAEFTRGNDRVTIMTVDDNAYLLASLHTEDSAADTTTPGGEASQGGDQTTPQGDTSGTVQSGGQVAQDAAPLAKQGNGQAQGDGSGGTTTPSPSAPPTEATDTTKDSTQDAAKSDSEGSTGEQSAP